MFQDIKCDYSAELQEIEIDLSIIIRLGFKTCLSKTKTKTQQFQDQDQDQYLLIQDQDQDFDVQDQDRDRDSRLTRPILEVHDWDEL